MNKPFIIMLRLAIVVALFWMIFQVIDWTDRYSRISANGEIISSTTGVILGNWNDYPVMFLEDGENNPIELDTVTSYDEQTIVVNPGIFTYLRNLDIKLFVMGALCWLCFIIIINSRWWWLLRANHLEISFLHAQRLSWIGFFFNNLLPGTTGGDIAKGVYIAKHCSSNRTQALMSVVVDRIIDLLSLLLVGGLASLFVLDRFLNFAILVWLAYLFVMVLCILLLSSRFRHLIHFQQIVERLPIQFSAIILKLDSALLQYRAHFRPIGIWIISSPIIYTLLVASIFFMDRSIGVGLTLKDYFFIVPIACVMQGIPIAPAGWGVGEAVYGLLVGKFGATALPGVPEAEQIMRTRGVALSVLHRVHVAAWSLPGGVLMVIEHYTKREGPQRTEH